LTQGVIDEIVVTGSRIKRRDFNTLSPLTMIDNEDIAFTGQATIPVSSLCATELTPT
jgi:outer membrane cobalamin receptor